MSHILNDHFDKVICISLVEREDKKKKAEKKFDELGMSVEFHRPVIHGYNKNIVKYLSNTPISKFNEGHPNEIGAALEHYTVIKTAYLQGVEKLFIFEDDCLFHSKFNELLPKYLDKLPTDWDMIMLYSFMYDFLPQNTRVSSRWIRAYQSWSLTSYGMNRKMMEEYLKSQDLFFTISDLTTYKLQERTDLNIYISTPCLCILDTDLGSNIRNEMNYKSSPTVLMTGVNEKDYTI